MLYKKSKEHSLDTDLFKNPTNEYRGTPFWAWNCEVKEQQIAEQIADFKQMGFGGYHIHSRIGMQVKYMSDRYKELVRFTVDEGKRQNMLSWLYDEDRWPSGSSGGEVAKQTPRFGLRVLRFTKQKLESFPFEEAVEHYKKYFVASFDIKLDENGALTSYRRIGEDQPGENKWYAYSTIPPEGPYKGPWMNDSFYTDTFRTEAIESFIKLSYEGYKQTVGDEFGKSIPAIFTDEPQCQHKEMMSDPFSESDILMPWSYDFADTYKEVYGEDIAASLPELFWEKSDGTASKHRFRFFAHVAERISAAYADTISKWCKKNGILFTGHCVDEAMLQPLARSNGDVMRFYKDMQLPGIDMLCNGFEYQAAKQVQSVVHQYGKEGALSELYGVTDWDFDFKGHKLQGDWQAALGITVRVPHLAWMTMYGEAKRDYPAAIGYQSPWYQKYSYIEDHFARLATVLTRGKPVVKVAVINAAESYWLHYGPKLVTEERRSQIERQFNETLEWLLFGQIDFDYLSEALLPLQNCKAQNGSLQVEQMEYQAVLVPNCETIRSTTLAVLKEFRKNGGKVVFTGEIPSYVDAEPSEEATQFAAECENAESSKTALLKSLKPQRTVELKKEDGSFSDRLLYNLRSDEDCDWIFIANGKMPRNKQVPLPEDVTIRLIGNSYIPTLYDTLSGETHEIYFEQVGEDTLIPYVFYEQDSLLLKLEKSKSTPLQKPVQKEESLMTRLPITTKFSLSEPNVLLLDTAEYSIDGGEFSPPDEILRIDNIFRKKFNLQTKTSVALLAWKLHNQNTNHKITLKFTFDSDTEVENARFATESLDYGAEITLNGEKVDTTATGWFCDKSIKTVNLPKIKSGTNTLTMTSDFMLLGGLEWCFLLGDFGVKLMGEKKLLTKLPSEIGYSTITEQGMPFYSGNITYHTEFTAESDTAELKIGIYKGAVCEVAVDGGPAGTIAFNPNTLTLTDLTKGKHSLDITLYGTRYNSFGCMHKTDDSMVFTSHAYWRIGGDRWTYGYELKPQGILKTPELTFYK